MRARAPRCWPSLFSALVAAAAYLNSLPCAFVFDDTLAVVNNKDVQSGAELRALFSHDFWGKPLVKEDSHKSYRPLTVLTFRLHTWWRAGPPQPAAFHAVNVLLHAAAAGCVSSLAARSCRRRQRSSLLAGLLFAVHPVHVEAVTGVVGRAELLCALFCFAGAAAYGVCAQPRRRPLARLCGALGFVCCFAAAVLSKETGITLLGVLGARELLVHLPRAARGARSRGWLRALIGSAARGLLLCLCGGGYAAMRMLLMRPEGSAPTFSSASLAESQLIRRAENPLAFARGRLAWALSVGRVQIEYGRLLLWPARLCIEYSYDCVPMSSAESLADLVASPEPRDVLVLLTLAGAAGVGVHLLRRLRLASCRRLLASSAWLLMPWLPISHVPLRLGTLVAERTLYLPSVGAALLACHLLRRTRLWSPGLGALPVGLAVGALAARSLVRSLDWRTDATAFEAAIQACPRSAKLHQQMCTLRTGEGRLDDAQRHCDTAHAIDPDFCDVHKSYAFLAMARDDIGNAIGSFNRSLSCVYTSTVCHKVLFQLYDLLHRRQPMNASLFSDMASTHAFVGNVEYAALLRREAAGLHLRAGRPLEALSAAEAGLALLSGGADRAAAADASPGESAAASADGPTPAACALQYWRGMALRRLERREAARAALGSATPCAANPQLGAAAAAELSQLDEALAPSAAAGSAAASTEAVGSGGAAAAAAASRPRVLLLSFHSGVRSAVEWVAERLDWDLSSPPVDEWLGGCEEEVAPSSGGGDSRRQQPGSAYRLSLSRARCLWRTQRLGERLQQYDLVVVADTTALAWPLLEAGWPGSAGGARRHGSARLLLWVCNRFDYGAVGDGAYYEAIRRLDANPLVSVVSSAPFEWKYAQHVRGVHFPSPAVIRPIGLLPTAHAPPSDPVPPTLDRASSFFVLPKVNEARMGLQAALEARGVAVWSPGVWPHGMQAWGGPAAVGGFKAAIHLPYAPTTFALFEHAQHGLLTFVPSAALMLKLYRTRGLFFQATPSDFVTTGDGTEDLSERLLAATEWYDPSLSAAFVYFDSLDDLVHKLATTDYAARRSALRAWAADHTNTTLTRWRAIDTFLLRRPREEQPPPGAADGAPRPPTAPPEAHRPSQDQPQPPFDRRARTPRLSVEQRSRAAMEASEALFEGASQSMW